MGLVPKLRFPEFRWAKGWVSAPLKKIADPVTDRATTGDAHQVLSLSGELGLVLQSEYFGKKVAGDSAERYLKLVRDDFVYNDRTTKASAYGTIKRLSKYDGGIVSPIYKCFRFRPSENPAFWDFYFESGNHDQQLRTLINEGARAGRFNISISQFLSTSALRPDEPEQQKIAECLGSLDGVIAAQGDRVAALRAHKTALMQQLFPRPDRIENGTKILAETTPRLRFPEFQNAGEWVSKTLLEEAKFFKGKGISKADIHEDGRLPCIRYGELYTRYGEVIDAVHSRTNMADSDLFFSKVNDVIIPSSGETKIDIAKASCVMRDGIALGGDLNVIRTAINGIFLSYYLNGPLRFEIARIAQGDSVVHLYSSQLEKMRIRIPPKPAEQQRIAECLTSLDTLIAAEVEKLSLLKTHNKGLMQQLFPVAEAQT